MEDLDNIIVTDEEVENIVENYKNYIIRCLSLGIESKLGEIDGLFFKLMDENKLLFVGYFDISNCIYDDTFILPDIFYGLDTKFICKDVFKDFNIKKIKFGKRLKEVYSGYSFRSLSFVMLGLEEVNLGGLTKLDIHYFSNSGKTKYIVGEDIDSIEPEAFKNNQLLEKVYFPSLTKVKFSSFNGCVSLKTINLINCNYIGKAAFRNCIELESVYLSKYLDMLDEFVFFKCEKLKYIDLSNIKSIYSNCFTLNKSLEMIDLLSCELIGSESFSECVKLKKVLNSVKLFKIEDSAFAKCYKLYEIDLSKVKYIGNQAFVLTALKEVDLSSCKSLGNKSFYFSQLESVTLGDMLTIIPKECFKNCPLKNINLENVEKICKYAFLDTLLEELDLRNCQEIESLAFYNTKLKKIKISDKLRKLGNHVFSVLDDDFVIEYYGQYDDFKERIRIGEDNDLFLNAPVIFK